MFRYVIDVLLGPAAHVARQVPDLQALLVFPVREIERLRLRPCLRTSAGLTDTASGA